LNQVWKMKWRKKGPISVLRTPPVMKEALGPIWTMDYMAAECRLTSLSDNIELSRPGTFHITKRRVRSNLNETRNKSIVPRRTMHTGRILSRAYAAIREWS